MQAEAQRPRANPDFTHQFGQVRPPISLDYQGYKFVVAGNKVVYQPKERAQFFTDILLTFVQNTFGRESCRFLPRPMIAAGAWYLLAGLTCITLGDNRALSPWTMGIAYGGGQLLVAVILLFSSAKEPDEI